MISRFSLALAQLFTDEWGDPTFIGEIIFNLIFPILRLFFIVGCLITVPQLSFYINSYLNTGWLSLLMTLFVHYCVFKFLWPSGGYHRSGDPDGGSDFFGA
jgi:hypothetical protein